MSAAIVRPIANPPTFGARGSTAVPNTTNTRKNVAIASRMTACSNVTFDAIAWPPRRVMLWTSDGKRSLSAYAAMIAFRKECRSYAQHWHLGEAGKGSMTEIVRDWRRQLKATGSPKRVALPHPSWRNNAWLTANPWFERDMLPMLRREIRRLLGA